MRWNYRLRNISLLVTIISLLILSCTTRVEMNGSKALTDEEAVVQVEQLVQETFDSIWSAMDTSAIRKYHTDDFLILEHGEVWNNDTIRDWANRSRPYSQGVTRTNRFERIKYKRDHERLWLAYHNYANIKQDTISRELRWLESVVAVYKEGVWKLELMHSTRVNR